VARLAFGWRASRSSTCDAQRGNGLGTTTKYLRRTTSGAGGSGLGTTAKYLGRTASGAAGNGPENIYALIKINYFAYFPR
jgi:hypothetical protein